MTPAALARGRRRRAREAAGSRASSPRSPCRRRTPVRAPASARWRVPAGPVADQPPPRRGGSRGAAPPCWASPAGRWPAWPPCFQPSSRCPASCPSGHSRGADRPARGPGGVDPARLGDVLAASRGLEDAIIGSAPAAPPPVRPRRHRAGRRAPRPGPRRGRAARLRGLRRRPGRRPGRHRAAARSRPAGPGRPRGPHRAAACGDVARDVAALPRGRGRALPPTAPRAWPGSWRSCHRLHRLPGAGPPLLLRPVRHPHRRQFVLAAVAACYGGGLYWLHRLSLTGGPSRFLSQRAQRKPARPWPRQPAWAPGGEGTPMTTRSGPRSRHVAPPPGRDCAHDHRRDLRLALPRIDAALARLAASLRPAPAAWGPVRPTTRAAAGWPRGWTAPEASCCPAPTWPSSAAPRRSSSPASSPPPSSRDCCQLSRWPHRGLRADRNPRPAGRAGRSGRGGRRRHVVVPRLGHPRRGRPPPPRLPPTRSPGSPTCSWSASPAPRAGAPLRRSNTPPRPATGGRSTA